MLDLLDYRRRVTDFSAWCARQWRSCRLDSFSSAKDDIFRTHPQSALDDEQKAAFTGLKYYPYDPAFRVVGKVSYDVEPEILDIELEDDGHLRMRRFGKVTFTVPTVREQ